MEAYGDEKAIRVENIFLDFLKRFDFGCSYLYCAISI